MKKFFKEFKSFITRGNVLDMAVGIIIGGAFTAIITAIVSNILTPLLAMIPGSGDTGALQIVLRKVYAEDGVTLDLAKSVIMDFGVVISAVITFLITAFVLFIIVKTINSVRDGGKKLKSKYAVLNKAECKQMREDFKAKGMNKREIDEAVLAADAERAAAEKAEQDRLAAEQAAAKLANAPETLLKEIRDLLAKSITSAAESQERTKE